MCDAHWLIDLVQSARTSILVKILLFQERESRSKELERHEKGKGFWGVEACCCGSGLLRASKCRKSKWPI